MHCIVSYRIGSDRIGLDWIVSDRLDRIYLLVTEFEVRTVSYGPSFFTINQREK